MKKYLQVIQATWAEYMIYRLNFILWRVRVVMQVLVVYFLWWAVFSQREELFGYTQASILTYVLLSTIVRTIVLGTTTMEVGNLIHQGNLSNYLVRPISLFRYYIARDTADKVFNIMFACVEFTLLFFLLKPPIFIQTNPLILVMAALSMGVAVVLYFCFSMVLGFLGFWMPDAWGPRFISFVIIEFFAGGLFPMDILPRTLFVISQILPFSYFIYFPLKVYLGQLSLYESVLGISVGVMWVAVFWIFMMVVWNKGLRTYTAEGR